MAIFVAMEPVEHPTGSPLKRWHDGHWPLFVSSWISFQRMGFGSSDHPLKQQRLASQASSPMILVAPTDGLLVFFLVRFCHSLVSRLLSLHVSKRL